MAIVHFISLIKSYLPMKIGVDTSYSFMLCSGQNINFENNKGQQPLNMQSIVMVNTLHYI